MTIPMNLEEMDSGSSYLQSSLISWRNILETKIYSLIIFKPQSLILSLNYTFCMVFFCCYKIMKIRSASRLSLFLTIIYNQKRVFKLQKVLYYGIHVIVVYLIFIVCNLHNFCIVKL